MDKIYTFLIFENTQNCNESKDSCIHAVKLGEEGMKTKNEEKIYSPSENVVNRILDFAKSYEVLKSTKTGCVELNLN